MENSVVISMRIVKHILEKKSRDSLDLVDLVSKKFTLTHRPGYIQSLVMYIQLPFVAEASKLSLEIIELLNHDAYTHTLLVAELQSQKVELNSIGTTRERFERIVKSNPEIIPSINDTNEAFQKLAKHFVQYGLSFAELESVANLMNKMPGQTHSIPATKYLLMKSFSQRLSVDITKHIYCDYCRSYVECNNPTKQKLDCLTCHNSVSSLTDKTFISINLKQQIHQMLGRHWEKIQSFLQIIPNDDSISDVYSGTVIKRITTQIAHPRQVLSCTMSTDGVSLEKSTNKSVWITQLICNFLPPEIRYKPSNILVIGIYSGDHKPDMLEVMKPLCEELEQLQESGVTYNNNSFEVRFTHAVFDLPAKAQIQNMMQYNGKHACSYCHHPGFTIDKRIKYPNMEKTPDIRTHEETIAIMAKIADKKSEPPINGNM